MKKSFRLASVGCLLLVSLALGACSGQTAKSSKGTSTQFKALAPAPTPSGTGTPIPSADGDCQAKFQTPLARCITPTGAGSLTCAKCEVLPPTGLCYWPSSSSCPAAVVVQGNSHATIQALLPPKPSFLAPPTGGATAIGSVCWYRIYGSAYGCTVVNPAYRVQVDVAPVLR